MPKDSKLEADKELVKDLSNPTNKVLAKTWNGNESGTLWEAYWCFEKEIGYYVDSRGPGFDNLNKL